MRGRRRGGRRRVSRRRMSRRRGGGSVFPLLRMAG